MLITVHQWRRVYLRFGRFVRDLTNMRYYEVASVEHV